MATIRTRTLLTGSAIAMLMATGSAYAQDATIYYETPTIRSGQPVVDPVPVITPVKIHDSVAEEAGATVPPTEFTAEDADYLGTPVVQTSGSDSATTFVSGGIGAFEKKWFDTHSNDFNLRVSYNDTTGHNLAGVNAALIDKDGTSVLETTTNGPLLLVKTKPGTYTLTSSYEGVSQSKKVTIGKGTARAGVTFTDTNPDQ